MVVRHGCDLHCTTWNLFNIVIDVFVIWYVFAVVLLTMTMMIKSQRREVEELACLPSLVAFVKLAR